MKTYTEMFKALGDLTRLRIIHLLNRADKELCVCEFVDSLEEPQYNISRHLKALRQVGLLKERKEGRWVYYSLNKKQGFTKSLCALIGSLSSREAILRADMKRLLKRLGIRVDDKCVLGVQKAHLTKKKEGGNHA